MNQGLYPLPGSGVSIGKLLRRTGLSIGSAHPAGDASTVTASIGLEPYSFGGGSSGVRRLLYSMRGKGAARLFCLGFNTATACRYEVVVDGDVVLDLSKASGTGSLALVGFVAGTASPFQVSLDYVPFEFSFDVYVTPVGTGGGYYGCLMDALR